MSAEEIKNLRKSLRLKQSELAILLGVSQNTIYLYEKGKRQPSPLTSVVLESLKKIAAANLPLNIYVYTRGLSENIKLIFKLAENL